jgi:hypothetical protein
MYKKHQTETKLAVISFAAACLLLAYLAIVALQHNEKLFGIVFIALPVGMILISLKEKNTILGFDPFGFIFDIPLFLGCLSELFFGEENKIILSIFLAYCVCHGTVKVFKTCRCKNLPEVSKGWSLLARMELFFLIAAITMSLFIVDTSKMILSAVYIVFAVCAVAFLAVMLFRTTVLRRFSAEINMKIIPNALCIVGAVGEMDQISGQSTMTALVIIAALLFCVTDAVKQLIYKGLGDFDGL